MGLAQPYLAMALLASSFGKMFAEAVNRDGEKHVNDKMFYAYGPAEESKFSAPVTSIPPC